MTGAVDRKQAELELRQLADAVPQHIVVLSGDGRRLLANQVVLDYHGLTLDEFLADDSLPKCFHPDDLENYNTERKSGMASEAPWEAEVRLRRKDGQYRWFLMRAKPLRDEGATLLRWYIAGTDIEDRKQAEQELRQLVNVVPQYIRVDDKEGNVLFANDRLLDYLGLTLEEVKASDFRARVCHPDDLDRVLAAREDAESRGVSWEVEARVRRKDGKYRWFLNRHNPLRDEHEQIVRWYATGTDIEDRKQAEWEVQQLVDAVPQHIVVLAADGHALYANKVALDFHGYTLEECLKEGTLEKKVHPADFVSYLKTRQHGLSSGLPFQAEVRLLSRTGEYRWFLVLFNPLQDEQGHVARWYATATDIEDRKQAERELRHLVDAVPHFVAVLSGDGRRLYVNEFALHFFGWTLQDFFDDYTVAQSFHPEDLASFLECRKHGISRGILFEVEARIRRKDGQYRWFLFLYNPCLNEQGKIERWYATGTDIEDRKQAEEALRRSAEQLTTQKAQLDELFEQAPEGIVLLDVEDRVLRINPEFTQLFGYAPDEAIGHPINDLIAPEELRSEAGEYTQRITHSKSVNAETIRRRKDGKRIHVSLLAVPVSVPGGGQIAEYAIYRDITERRRAEEALRRSEGYLAEAQRISHTGSFAHDAVRGEILYWSPETYRLFGFDPQKGTISFQEARSRIHPDDLQRFDEARERGIREKTGAKIDFRIVLGDGSIKHIHCVSHPVFNASGKVVEMVGTNMDVTEQHDARAALEKAFEEIKQLKDQLYRENLALKEEIDHASMFEEIVGTSDPLRRVLVQVAKVAPADSTVLISGETGTGKELVARAIHRRSKRSSRAFVSVNCAAIPAALIGSELFGHEKGAFTGAIQRRLGRFELADGGTLFLDEVGDLPAETQIALLRVLQERQFERIGGAQPISVDVRIIAATNRDLKAAVSDGAFRSDLYYRLNVFPIAVPPLRERKDDLPLLVEYLIERYASKAGKKIRNVHKQTLELFQSYDWPGNIRELQNVVERAVILCDGDTFSVDESWLQPESRQSRETGNGLARLSADREKELIESALARSRGKIAGPSGAAAKLGVPRSTLETKIRKLGIKKHRFKST